MLHGILLNLWLWTSSCKWVHQLCYCYGTTGCHFDGLCIADV